MVEPLRSQILGLDLDRHLAIDAGAGTGKTTVMALRYIEHLLESVQRATELLPPGPRVPLTGSGSIRSPARELTDLGEWRPLLPTEVVAITFTNKAAEELRQRIRSRLSQLRSAPDPEHLDSIVDTRLRRTGDTEQLIGLLEDAPIGTIDSFLSNLVGPHLGMVAEDPSSDLVSDAKRPILLIRSINTAWRINSPAHATIAGVGMDPSAFIESRDRLAWQLGGRNGAERVLMAMLKQPLFVEESERRLRLASGGVQEVIALRAVQNLLLQLCGDLSIFAETLRTLLSDWLNELSAYSAPMGLATGLASDTRIACLDAMANNPIPSDDWELLLWVHHACWATMAAGAYDDRTPNALPGGRLPTGKGDAGWPSGLKPYGGIPEASRQTAIDDISAAADLVRTHISTLEGHAARKFAGMAWLMDPSLPIIALPSSGVKLPTYLTEPLSRHMDETLTVLPSNLQVSMLEDLFILHSGVQNILRHMKRSEGVYDHSDMQRYAEDLLLSRCPDICRHWYPTPMLDALDSMLTEAAWTDGHILRALDAAPPGEDGERAKQDLERRYGLLKRLRRRYRAFIIDEYQDTNLQQYRLLARLWGRRELNEGEPMAPMGPWDPTICLVGDVKQSIYRFRQAQVTVMSRAIEAIRSANLRERDHETRLQHLRRHDQVRDPRPVAGGVGEESTFAKASSLRGGEVRANERWNRIDLADDDSSIIDNRYLEQRREGHIDLTTNFRTAGNVLETLNVWFDDVFAESHHLLPGPWHAISQELHPPPPKVGEEPEVGRIEWLAAVSSSSNTPPENLDIAVNPFEIGNRAKPWELEHEMIAARLHSLITGQNIRLRGTNDEDKHWLEVDGGESVSPEEILILVPRRAHIDDLLRRLQAWGVPAQADKQGSLFARPVVRELNHLLQALAHPRDRHDATAFARGCFAAFTDSELNTLMTAQNSTGDLLADIIEMLPEGGQCSLLQSVFRLRESGQLIEALELVLEHGDVLLVYPGIDAVQDAEQYLDLLSSMMSEVGGDPVLLADAVSELSKQETGGIESEATPPSGAVRVMTIHAAKGLESRVVVVAGLFHEGHYSSAMDKQSSFVVTPELLAANLRPWRHVPAPLSGTWEFTKALLDAQTAAERRRLFYVALTRVENHLILVGAPNGSSIGSDGSLRIKRPVTKLPSFGEMWLDALRVASHTAGDANSPWLHEDDDINQALPHLSKWKPLLFIDPTQFHSNPHLGRAPLAHLDIIHDIEGLSALSQRPSIRTEMRDHIERAELASVAPQPDAMPTPRRLNLKMAAHKLDSSDACERRLWLSDIRGWSTEPILPRDEVMGASGTELLGSETGVAGLPGPASLGTLFHRLVEIGIGNPVQNGETPFGIDRMWTMAQRSGLCDEKLISQVIEELMPADADANTTGGRLLRMGQLQEEGRLGKLCAGETVSGQKIVGLRTELPFHVAISTDASEHEFTVWTPGGTTTLADIDSAEVIFNGFIDLSIAIDEGDERYLQVIDLKTEECSAGFDEDDPASGNPLQQPVSSPRSTDPQNEAESHLLHSHRLQLALYTLVLEQSQQGLANGQARLVLPPAIQACASGRMLMMTQDELVQAKLDLANLLDKVARMHLNPEVEPSRLPADDSAACKICPYYNSAIRLCGPQQAPLGPI